MSTVQIKVTELNKLILDPIIILNKGSYGVDKIKFTFLSTYGEDFIIRAVLKLNDRPEYNVFLDSDNEITIPEYATRDRGTLKIKLVAVTLIDGITTDIYKEVMAGSPNLHKVEKYLEDGKSCCGSYESAIITSNIVKLVVE